jgi:hypothetical protein
MKALHLTDEEIQEYLLNKQAVDISTMEHASTCEECKARISDYQLLFAGIKQQPQPVFDFDLAELVIAQLPATKPVAAPGHSFIYIFVVAAIAIAGAAIYYFRTYIASLFTSITPLLIYLAATTVIMVAVMLSLDMYRNYNRKMRALDFY